MKMFELLPRPLGSIFRKLTHLTCNSRTAVEAVANAARWKCFSSQQPATSDQRHATNPNGRGASGASP